MAINFSILKEYGLIIAFLLVCIIITVISPNFLTVRNILNVLTQISMNGIIAVGLTFVILGADINLSVGSVAAFSGVLAAGLNCNNDLNMLWSLLIPLIIATILGILMGLVITKFNVHSFVVSLGMLSIARGLTLIYTDGFSISGISRDMCYLGGGRIGYIPVPVIVFLLIALIGYYILEKTSYGRYIYAVGGNKEATRLSGINVDFVRTVNFGVSSMLAGLAGIILTTRLASGQPTACEGWELDGIAAVIIGGTSLFGGRGGIKGTVIGVLFLGVLRNGLNLMGVSPFYQRVFIGLLIIFAVILDRLRVEAD